MCSALDVTALRIEHSTRRRARAIGIYEKRSGGSGVEDKVEGQFLTG